MLQWVNGQPNTSGWLTAAVTKKASSSDVIRRGRPPAQRGFNDAIPNSLNRWITSRTVSSSVATSRTIAVTVFPPADASTIVARRNRIGLAGAPGCPPPHQPLQQPALLIRQPPHPNPLSHQSSMTP